MFGWTADAIQRLTALWLGGVSASLIAMDIGHGVTRCAVMGKVRRLRLIRMGPFVPQHKPMPPRAEWKTSEKPKPRKRFIAAHRRQMITRKAPIRAPGLEKAIAIAELERHHCRWIVSEIDGVNTLYCGGRRVNGWSYCAWHVRQSINRPK